MTSIDIIAHLLHICVLGKYCIAKQSTTDMTYTISFFLTGDYFCVYMILLLLFLGAELWRLPVVTI